MILSRTAEYAIRAAVSLALLQDQNMTSARDIAKESGVPRHYLSKILKQLVNSEILSAKKGVGGGFYFIHPLNKISLLDILNAVDFNFNETYCPFGWKLCNNTNPCPLHKSYSKLKASYLRWVKETTIEKVAGKRL